jgi:hypothetical protein
VSLSMNDVQEIWDRDERLYALALKARDDNLTELAAKASAHAERLSGKLQEPTEFTLGTGKASPR